MREILFVTGNEGKVREAQLILGDDFMLRSVQLDLEEIQALDGKEIVRHKIEEAMQQIGTDVLADPDGPLIMVDDVSLYFAAWNALPGALIKWFLESVGSEGICKMMLGEEDRRAWLECVVGYWDGKKIGVAVGKLKGSIAIEPQGEFGFGFDDIYIPEGETRTFAEMSVEEKSSLSHRKLAFESLKDQLQQSGS